VQEVARHSSLKLKKLLSVMLNSDIFSIVLVKAEELACAVVGRDNILELAA
jgi:hypothetical protein